MGIHASLCNPSYWASHDKHLASDARGDELDSVYSGERDLSLVTSEANSSWVLTDNRVPHYSHTDLTRWYKTIDIKKRSRVLNYYLSRCQIDLEILEAQELVARVW